MLRRAALFPLLLAATLLAGCASLGLQSPETFNERLAYGVSTHAAAVDSITAAVQSGELDPDSAEELVDTAEQALELMRSARRVHDAGDVTGAARQLTLALAVLAELQRFNQQE